MSLHSETPQINSRNRTSRITPSTRLNMIWPPSAGSIFLSSVAATSGTYLYMKMKKAREITMLIVANQPLMAAAFSRVCDLVSDLVSDDEDSFGSVSARFGAEPD